MTIRYGVLARALAISIAAALTYPALGQQNRSSLTTYNNTYIIPNGRGAITGPILNTELNDFINSFGVVNDTNAWTGNNIFSINPQFSGCFGYPFSTGTGAITCSSSIGGVTFNAISPISYGAKCDGTTDDTAALQAWATHLVSGVAGYVPGVCVYKSSLALFPTGATNPSIIGNGAGSQLLYAGSGTNINAVTMGQANSASNGCSLYNLTVSNVAFMSTTTMSGGTGLTINSGCQTDITNVQVGSNLGAAKTWYNAVWFNGGNTLHVRGYVFVGSENALVINGDTIAPPGPYAFTDPFFEQGIAIGAVYGYHVAGAVGGLTIDQGDGLQNGTNLIVDQSVTARANLQLFFLGGFYTDATTGGAGIGVDVQDPGGPYSILSFKDSWLATASNVCLKLEAGTTWRVDMHGGQVLNCGGGSGTGGGIYNNSTTNLINIAGTNFDENAAYGIDNAVNDVQVSVQAVHYGIQGVNTPIGYPISQTYIDPNNNVISSASVNGLLNAGTTQIIGAGANTNCGVWYQATIAIPGGQNFTGAGCNYNWGTTTYPWASMATIATLAAGAPPTITGCSVNTQTGGNTAGSFKFNGSCSAAITLTFLTSAPNGWHCDATNMSANTALVENGYSANTVQFANPAATNGQQVQFGCSQGF